MIVACAFCGRENESGSRFCMDCGKPLDPAARAEAHSQPQRASAAEQAGARQLPGGAGRPSLSPRTPSAPFAPPAHFAGRGPAASGAPGVPGNAPLTGGAGAGTPPSRPSAPGTCPACETAFRPGDMFCSRCGARVGSRVSVEQAASSDTLVFGARRTAVGPRLALLDEEGEVATVFTLERGEAVIGRGDADIRFADDAYMSPLHARLEMRDGALWLRDLGARNMSWVFIHEPSRLGDGDLVLVGSQVIRFRRLGFPGPHTPDADSTRRMGSLTPSTDVAVLEQLRADGSVRDMLHLSPGRTVALGREAGDWVFPYDQTMSGRHAEVRSEDAEFVVHDAGSRNGIAIAVRGERPLRAGQRLLLGDQQFRVEST